jgi:hypothetical protein
MDAVNFKYSIILGNGSKIRTGRVVKSDDWCTVHHPMQIDGMMVDENEVEDIDIPIVSIVYIKKKK